VAVKTARDGSRVFMRPIEPDDKRALVTGFERLSDESRYRRFLTPTPRLTDAQLRYLTEVDHDRHEAIIAFAEETGEPVGVARYVRLPDDPATAEPAVTVVDEWQARGVGTFLLEELSERARAAGVKRFAATALAGNKPIIALLDHLGPGEKSSEGGIIHIEAELPPSGIAPRLHAALRDAAADRLALLKGIFELGRSR
jgi:GNAT superfamily N-acetyltransferase